MEWHRRTLSAAYRGALRLVGGKGLGRVWPFSLVKRWLDPRLPGLKTHRAQVHGHAMRLDALDSLGLSVWGTFEPFETELLQSLVRAGDAVVDAGANVGYYTLLLARSVGPDGRVYAFEPEAGNFAILEENIATNGYRNIQAERKALADENGRASLAVSDTNLADHRLRPATGRSDAVEVGTITLDTFLAGRDSSVALIKMDVQGAELRVLRGMNGLLARQTRLTIVLEFCPSILEQQGDDPAELLALLRSHGFALQEIVEEARELRAVRDGWYVRERFGEGLTNLLCVRGPRP